jgi:hypothetical protein
MQEYPGESPARGKKAQRGVAWARDHIKEIHIMPETQTVLSGFEAGTWSINNNTQVNPVPADDFKVVQWTGGMTTQIVGSKAYAGAEAYTPIFNIVPGTSEYTLAYKMMFPGAALVVAQALEFDMMGVAPDTSGAVANMSCQCVVANNWMWMIAGAGGNWVATNISTPLLPNAWNSIVVRFSVNWTAKTVTCLSITVNGVIHPVPASLGAVPFNLLKWNPPSVMLLQRQLVVGANGGIFSVDDTEITVTQQ